MVNPVDDRTSILDRFEIARSRAVVVLEDRASGCHCKARVDLQNHKCRLIQVDGDNGITEIDSEKCDWCVQDCDPHGRFLFILHDLIHVLNYFGEQFNHRMLR